MLMPPLSKLSLYKMNIKFFNMFCCKIGLIEPITNNHIVFVKQQKKITSYSLVFLVFQL